MYVYVQYNLLNFSVPNTNAITPTYPKKKRTESTHASQVVDLAAPIISGVYLRLPSLGVLHRWRRGFLYYVASLWLVSGFGGRVPLEVGICRLGIDWERSGMQTARAGQRAREELGLALEGDVVHPLVDGECGREGEEEGDGEEEVEEVEDLWIHLGRWRRGPVLLEKDDDVREEEIWGAATCHVRGI
jgi:hypothetical protein